MPDTAFDEDGNEFERTFEPEDEMPEDEFGFTDEWYEEQGATDHALISDEPQPEVDAPDDILEDLREREKRNGPGIIRFSPEDVVEGEDQPRVARNQEERNRAWAAWYASMQDEKRREAEAAEGWGEPKDVPEVEKNGIPSAMPKCPACGWTVDLCDVHDEEELEIIREHEAGIHDKCVEEGCQVRWDAYIEEIEREEEEDFRR